MLVPQSSGKLSSAWLESLLFALLFCGYPVVSFLPEFLPLPGRSASIGFRLICLVLSFSVIVRGRLNLKRVGWPFQMMLCFWMIYLIRVIYDYYYLDAPGPLEFREYVAYTYGISFTSMLAMFFVRDWQRLRYAPQFCIAFCSFTCVLAIKFGVSSSELETIGRLSANERLNPISLGHTATTLILSALWYILRHKDRMWRTAPTTVNELKQLSLKDVSRNVMNVLRVPLLVLLIGVGLYALGLSASRSPALALLIGLSLIAIWLRTRVVYLVVLVVGAVVGFLQLDFLSQLSSMGVSLDRILGMGLQAEDYGGGGRTELYREAWEHFTSAPLFGSSLFLQNGIYPHNLILEVLMSTGFAGGIPFSGILYLAFRNLITQSKGSHMVFWLLVLFMQAFTGAMSSGAIYYDPAMWGMVGLGIGLATVTNRQGVHVAHPHSRAMRVSGRIGKGAPDNAS